MNNYEEWAQLVAKNLKGEADLIAAINKDELDDNAATQAFIRAVLEPFIPENFGIGSGRVADAFGNYSDHLDIIIYNRDFPRIGVRGSNAAFLYESVLACFAIRAKFVRKTFFEALDACASLADLNANIDKTVLVKLARKNGLRFGPNKTFVHDDPLRTARFHLIGRPPAFVFGFSGIKNSYRQLQQNIELWFEHHRSGGNDVEMKGLPAVIATQGCFAWRNAAPLALSNREMLGIGNDAAPVRLIVLQLLYLLNRRLNVTADGYGLRPSLKAYLGQFSPPSFELGVGNVAEVHELNQAVQQKPAAEFESAKDHTPKPTAKPNAAVKAAAEKAETVAKPAPAPAPAEVKPTFDSAPKTPAAPTAAPPPVAQPAKAAADNAPKTAALGSAPIPPTSGSTATGNNAPKTAPLGSAPIPAMEGSKAASESAPKTAPLGSAPIPPMTESAPAPDNAPKTAPLGSAPIPAMASQHPAADKPPVTAPLGSAPIPPKPPVDIIFDNRDEPDEPLGSQAADEPGENDFESTMIIPPPNAGSEVKKPSASQSSTDAFIARVKEQLSSSDNAAHADTDKEKDPFSSTIPH